MKLQFPIGEIAHWAGKYDYALQEGDLKRLQDLECAVAPAKTCGFLTLDQLRAVARWKSPRSAERIEKNDDDYVRVITRFALHTENERARIESLTLLNGVKWPSASVILHFFHAEKYPILDFRALWSVGAPVPTQYTFPFWWEYVLFCRELADRSGTDMRTLDKALWAYSKKNQDSKPK